MALESFDFMYHRLETLNPESGFRAQFGGSYLVTAAPDAPDMRVFKLAMTGMQFFLDSEGIIDETQTPDRNMKRLINFYHTHKLHKSFLYSHNVHGVVEVKFNKPLPEPKGVVGGFGVVEDFEIELIEIP